MWSTPSADGLCAMPAAQAAASGAAIHAAFWPLNPGISAGKLRIRRFGAMDAPSALRTITWGAASSPQMPRLKGLL